MDHGAFDSLARSTADTFGTRRGVLRIVVGGALGIMVGSADLSHEAEARRKKKHGGKGCGGANPVKCPPTAENPRQICFPAGAICCGSALGGGACHTGESCCPPSLEFPGGSCAGPDFHCCPPDSGGGACPLTSPTCCPPTEDSPAGFCSPSDVKCCNFSNVFCLANEDCCPPSFDFPDGGCVQRGTPCPRGGDRHGERNQMVSRPSRGLSRAGGRHLQQG
jgi:hypothetical protein